MRSDEAQASVNSAAFIKRWGMVLILGGYLLLGFVYSLTVPLFEAPDELYHYAFVKHLADGHGLPVLRSPGLIGLWRQEGGQPPLYYILGALLTRWIDTRDASRVIWRNPHADVGRVTPDRNVNIIVHTSREHFPFRGTVLAVHLLRIFSVALGALAVWRGYKLACEVLSQRGALPLYVMAMIAFQPMFLFITSSVNNDALAIFLGTFALELIVRYVSRVPTMAHWALLGLVLGMGALSKLSLLGLVPLAGLSVLLIAWRQRSWRTLLGGGGILLFISLGLSGWWFYRNWSLYKDPLGLRAFLSVIGKRYPQPNWWQLLGEWHPFIMSFWGFFGWLNVPAPSWYYVLVVPLGGLGILALPWGIWKWHRICRVNSHFICKLTFAVLWPILLFASLWRWTSLTPATQGRLLFPGIAALMLCIALGLWGLMPQRWQYGAVALLGGVALVASLLFPFLVIAPAYRPPRLLERGALAPQVHLDATFGDGIRLLGYDLLQRETKPGGEVALRLYWECLRPLKENYSLFIHLERPAG
ncbi:MAG: DUF2142 domain-containing protein, partial [Anaerolineae bacterium]|nr:DUF2142 domain-containing protein [Anaerolineae bacterium]